jgi:hypothetical protein
VSPTFAVAVEIGSSNATLRIVPAGTSLVEGDAVLSCGAVRSSESSGRPSRGGRSSDVRDWLAARRLVALRCDTTTGSAVITDASAPGASSAVVVVVVVVVVIDPAAGAVASVVVSVF